MIKFIVIVCVFLTLCCNTSRGDVENINHYPSELYPTGHDHDHNHNLNHNHNHDEYPGSTGTSESPCGGEWTIYTNDKCLRLINNKKLLTWAEADALCRRVAKSDQSSLVTVKTPEEQRFLQKYLFDDNSIFDNVWLGLKADNNNSTLKELRWVDESLLVFSKLSTEREDLHKTDCVQLPTTFESLYNPGIWTLAPCNKSNLVVCEKLQEWSLKTIQRRFIDATLQLKTEIELLKNRHMVPVGFVYIQLAFQLAPTEIWPGEAVWNDVSADYAGLFLRVLGGQSAGWNQTQSDSSPRLTAVKYAQGYDSGSINIIPTGEWSPRVYSGSDQGNHYGLSFKVSSDEVRPKNQAVRVWKRVK